MNKALYVRAMREVQGEVFDLIVKEFNATKDSFGDCDPEVIWVTATRSLSAKIHELTKRKYNDIKYRIGTMTPATQPVGSTLTTEQYVSVIDEIKQFLTIHKEAGAYIICIKEIREHYQLSLKEAKDLVDIVRTNDL